MRLAVKILAFLLLAYGGVVAGSALGSSFGSLKPPCPILLLPCEETTTSTDDTSTSTEETTTSTEETTTEVTTTGETTTEVTTTEVTTTEETTTDVTTTEPGTTSGPTTTTAPPPQSGGGGPSNAPPIISIVGPGGPVEATGPNGAPVFYTVSASDREDGGIPPVCTRPSGAVLPLGKTTITCTATDSGGKKASRSIEVVVRDTTAPVLTSPRQLEVLSLIPISKLAPVIAEWLSYLAASDLVDPNPTVTDAVPLMIGVGETPVVFTAIDDSGNVAASTVLLRVSTTSGVSPNGPLPDSAKPDVAPRDVASVKVSYGNLSVTLTWRPPPDVDFDHVAIFRTPGKNARASAAVQPESLVYEGAARRYVDIGLKKGRQYRYLLVSYDAGGARSVGVAVVVVGQANALLAPRHGSEVTRPPRLSWKPHKGATYYNVQVYRRGRKILSLWPNRAAVQLRSSWTYAGRRYQLTPGLYTWFVWPGIGPMAKARYGELLGQSEFMVDPRARASG